MSLCPTCVDLGVEADHDFITEDRVDRVAYVLSHKGPEENEDTNWWQLADEALHAIYGEGTWLA